MPLSSDAQMNNRVNSVKPQHVMMVAILSQAIKGLSFIEGAETRFLSPNNNEIQERPTS